MKQSTAGKIGDSNPKYIGKTVSFPDFHGRNVTGTLQDADAPTTAVYASLTVAGRTYSVFRNTPVQVSI
jgi:hypothetical protein